MFPMSGRCERFESNAATLTLFRLDLCLREQGLNVAARISLTHVVEDNPQIKEQPENH